MYACIPFLHTSALPGSGKTHSLFGDLSSEGLEGIVPRAVHELTDMLFRTENGALSSTCSQVMCMSIVFYHALASKGMIKDNAHAHYLGASAAEGTILSTEQHVRQLVYSARHDAFQTF